MPGPSVRSPVDEFRRRRREAQDAAREAGRGPGEAAAAAVDPNHDARERWRQETVEALRQVPPVSRLDQD